MGATALVAIRGARVVSGEARAEAALLSRRDAPTDRRHQRARHPAAADVLGADRLAASGRAPALDAAREPNSPANSPAPAPRSIAPICFSPASRRSSSPGSGPTASRASRAIFRWSPTRRCRAACSASSPGSRRTWPRTMDQAVERLLERGEAFSVAAASLKGRHFEIDGRAVAGCAVMRIRDVSGDRLQLVRLRESHAEANSALARCARCSTRSRIPPGRATPTAASPGPISPMRAPSKRTIPPTRQARGLELFDTELCAEALVERASARASGGATRPPSSPASASCSESSRSPPRPAPRAWPAIFPRSRRCAPRWSGTCGAYSRMLDQLSTAVAIFDRAKRLIFYNAAYRQIWSLDPAFLDQQPTDGEVLDRLRAKRQLPEQADFRSWKAQALAAYQAIEPTEIRLASAGRAHVARRRQPQSARRRHLSLRRRHAELCARIAIQRADPRAGRNARRAEGRRRGVRRGRAAEAHQSRPSPRCGGFDAARRRRRPHIDEVARQLRAAARRFAACGTGCGRRSSACPRSAAATRRASSARTAWCSIAPRCRCPTARRCSPSST